MATRKKKIDVQVNYLVVTVGSHLTVTTHEDGSTELSWDDDALMRDVREAIASVEGVQEVKPKRKKKATNELS